MFNWFRNARHNNPGPTADKPPRETLGGSATPAGIQSQSAAYKTAGDEHLNAGSVDEAVAQYRQALTVDPQFAEAHRMLGDALREQGNLVEAARSYRAAMAHAPRLAEAHYGLGVTLLERSDAANATVHFKNALGLKPDFAAACNGLGFALLTSGKPAEALNCFQKTISLEPHNGMALHLMASLTGSNPERAPRQYVEKLFDGFANTFDSNLHNLKYDTPQKLIALIARISAPAPGKWNTLDLGCGTGLVGVLLAPYSRQLVGVDLSAKMLAKARARNLYHRLVQSDLIAMMNNEPDSAYDLVVATDTFIYLGKLDGVVKEAKRLLGPGGLFAFSVEALETLETFETLPGADADHHAQRDYRLQPSPSCRYAHSAQYVSRLAVDNGFKMLQLTTETLRMSCGKSVTGYLVILQKTS